MEQPDGSGLGHVPRLVIVKLTWGGQMWEKLVTGYLHQFAPR
jgi:hypothetical protein